MNTQALLQLLRERWTGLNTRERRLAVAGASIASLAFLYVLLWVPLHVELARLRGSVPDAQSKLAQMRGLAAQIQPLRARSVTPPAGGLTAVIEQSATARNLRGQISKLEAEGNNGVQFSVDGIAFNSLIAWLTELQDNYGLRVDQATLDAHKTVGMVSGRLRLRAAAT
jgi:general secretion pathway protein M